MTLTYSGLQTLCKAFSLRSQDDATRDPIAVSFRVSAGQELVYFTDCEVDTSVSLRKANGYSVFERNEGQLLILGTERQAIEMPAHLPQSNRGVFALSKFIRQPLNLHDDTNIGSESKCQFRCSDSRFVECLSIASAGISKGEPYRGKYSSDAPNCLRPRCPLTAVRRPMVQKSPEEHRQQESRDSKTDKVHQFHLKTLFFRNTDDLRVDRAGVSNLAGLYVTPVALQPRPPLVGRANATKGVVPDKILVSRESLLHKPVRDLQIDGRPWAPRDCLKAVDVARIFSIQIGHGGLKDRRAEILA
jgi:hypothetical protein